MESARKNPGIAAVLSFIFCGLGQLYNGEIIKGLVLIFFSGIGLVLLVVGSTAMSFWLCGKLPSNKVFLGGCVLFFVGLVAICALAIYSIVNAYRTAARK